ncbi:MAG TPA: cation:proton antiporter [Gemmataceae bacterium]|nr:cation:proton antiporter [Gemmataceae bacterium]
MDGTHFLRDLLIAFAVAGGAVFVAYRLRLPSVVGLLAAGVLAGPHGFGLIHDPERIKALAEVGVVILLFAVGLEFSLPRLVGMGRLMVRIGIPQVGLCVLAGVAATWAFFGDVRPAVLAGMLLAMSSTAIVFKLLTDRGEVATPHGNVSAAVLLFQDLLVVGCMVLLPLLAARKADGPPAWQTLAVGVGVVAALVIGGRYLLPRLLHQVVRTHNRELFLIALVLVCLGSAALTGSMGWSLALGAFLAGLALSESEYATQTLAEALPFRDTLASLFFVSVGMLLDVRFVTGNLPLVVGLVAGVVLVKFLAGGLPVLLSGYPLRTAALTGLALAQIGEFSFILADRGLALGLLDRDQYQAFLAVAVLTVALTPALIAAGPRLAERLEALPLPARWRAGRGAVEVAGEKVAMTGHVVIVGYGLNGRNLARVLRVADIPYVVLELNPETVRQAKARGEPVQYGDCTRPAVLEHLGVAAARVLVVAISDPASSRRAVQLARGLNRRLHVIARTRYLAEVAELRRLGANIIIPEEFETSVEIFARVLREYEVPRNLILSLVDRVRGEHYEVLRDLKLPAMQVVLPYREVLEKLDVGSCWLREKSPVVGKSVGEVNLRAETGATLVALRRSGKLVLNPGADLRFQPDDVAVLIGDRGQVHRAVCVLDPDVASATSPGQTP